MKNLTVTLFFLLIIANLSAEIAVKSFRKLESDMTARIDAPKKDQNGDVCAIIKVVTTQTGFIWEPDGLGIISSEWKNGEYWLYVPYGAKRMTVKHDKLGVLRDYLYPMPIEKACVYEMKLITGRIETTVIEEIAKQWLVITPLPEKAMIYIDDVFVAKGEYQAQLSPGTYNYRVEAPLYHTEAGKLEISDAKNELKVNLKPAFGYLNINTTPEAGATIIIDGKEITKTTPATIEALASGEHSVQVIKEMYQPATQKVMIIDNQTTPVNFTLTPNFAELNITAPQQASIVINGQLKGKGGWNGRLSAGIYTVEAQMDKHRVAKLDIPFAIGDKKEITLQPTPIYGAVDIVTTPSGATISIDGKEYGTTPNRINNLLIGDYTVVIHKMGYETISRNVTINEKNSENVNFSLTLEKPRSTTEKTEISNTISDIDGNEYNTIKIGNQTWMVENLRVKHYRNGDEIPNIVSNNAWTFTTTGAWCIAEYNLPKIEKYGLLYNWFAVSDNRGIAPIGWHVASDHEWKVLEDYIKSNYSVSGSVAKALASKYDWETADKIDALGYNISTNNSSGFSALPASGRDSNGMFFMGNYYGYWWSATQKDNLNAWNIYLYNYYSFIKRLLNSKNCGFSVRCVKDSNNENIEIINDKKIVIPVTPINNTNQVNSESTTKSNESPSKVRGSGYSPDYNSGSGYSSPTYNSGNTNSNSRSSTYKRR